MNPSVILYFASKRKESGKFHIIPPPDRGYGVVILYMKDGNIIGLESTWGSSLDNLEKIFEWPKGIVRKYDLTDAPVKVFIPNEEIIHKIVFRDLSKLENIGKRIPTGEEVEMLLKMSVGIPKVLSADDVKKLKSSLPKNTFFLQSGNKAISVILGRIILGFSYENGIKEIKLEDFPEEEAKMVPVDHIVALSVNLPFFIKPREFTGKEGVEETKKLINKDTSIWMSVFYTKGGVYIPAVGYKGVFIGVVIKTKGEIKLLPEAFVDKVLELGEVYAKIYEYDPYMYSP